MSGSVRGLELKVLKKHERLLSWGDLTIFGPKEGLERWGGKAPRGQERSSNCAPEKKGATWGSRRVEQCLMDRDRRRKKEGPGSATKTNRKRNRRGTTNSPDNRGAQRIKISRKERGRGNRGKGGEHEGLAEGVNQDQRLTHQSKEATG